MSLNPNWPTLNRVFWLLLMWAALGVPVLILAESEPETAHRADHVETPTVWPEGIIPFDLSRLTTAQQATVHRAMQRWMDTGARVAFVPRTTQSEYVSFTGRTDAGNNTSQTGFKSGAHAEINITAFWWEQGEWMPAHELGHVLGFHHEHQRWDRDAFIMVHYEHIKPGRSGDYDWIPKTNWLVSTTPYDFYSIMHYRVCWASSCESQCKDANGSSPCAVLQPILTNYDAVIGQWDQNKISAGDGERLRLTYGIGRTVYVQPNQPGEGLGTLEMPYSNLSRARQKSPANSRITLLSTNGEWSVSTSSPPQTKRGE